MANKSNEVRKYATWSVKIQKVSHLEGHSLNYSKLFRFVYKGSLTDAEVTIWKYKWLIINGNSFILGQLKWFRGTVGGRKIGKNLQMKLPSKIKYINICKDIFPVLCIFTFVNTDFCTFLYSLRSEWRATFTFCPFRYIYLCSSLYIFVILRKIEVFSISKSDC